MPRLQLQLLQLPRLPLLLLVQLPIQAERSAGLLQVEKHTDWGMRAWENPLDLLLLLLMLPASVAVTTAEVVAAAVAGCWRLVVGF